MLFNNRLNHKVKFCWILSVLAIGLVCSSSCNRTTASHDRWEVYGGSKENIRYSSLDQIDTSNVKKLKKVWEFKTQDQDKFTQIQTNPIVIDTVLYGVSPKLKLFALHAATGEQKWLFDPFEVGSDSVLGTGYFSMNVCRGVTFYSDENSKRIFYAAGATLFCIDAQTGLPIADFGTQGKLDLHQDLDRDASQLYIAMTSPGIIFQDLIIIGSRVNEGAAAAPGYIRAYDVHTGALRWKFHTIPKPGEEGYESWEDKEAWKNIGGANAWAGFSLDEKRGIVYAPIGSASYDFYGGKRKGANLFANSIVALDAATGKKIWHFQTVHHDVWDRDLPTAPALVTVERNGKKIDAVAQPTKGGLVFLFDRTDGTPLFPIEEIPVPDTSDLAGEQLSPTQPWLVGIEPFARQRFTANEINPYISEKEQKEIKLKLDSLVTGFTFHPPSKKGTVIFPGFDGGAEWGGPAYDPETNLLYINSNEMPWILTMVDQQNKAKKTETNFSAGKRLYQKNCMACHGRDLKGTGNNPSLVGVEKRYTEHRFNNLLQYGRRMMPAFAQLQQADIEALASYVLKLADKKDLHYTASEQEVNPYWEMPYTSTGYNKFLTKDGYPAIRPPWGTLNALDLTTGKISWKIPIGNTKELQEKGIHTGTENYGGPIVTAGGLVFLAATKDGMFRAFNKKTGALLWETKLPYPAYATPATYSVEGKQYLVIACGGGKLGTPSGDVYLAFSL